MKTKVKYLYHEANDEVFAFFPELKQGRVNYLSYAHIGQHSECCIEYANECIKATNEQIKPLKRELESLGYDLDTVVERLIKDPYFESLSPNLGEILSELNKDRDSNGLRTEMEENDLKFDSEQWARDYCESIGVRFKKVNDFELWYYITLENFAALKATKWDFDEVGRYDKKYISNYDELAVEVLEDDIENQAEDLMDEINENIWKYGGRYLGSTYGSGSLIELNDGLIKYFVNTDFEIEIKPAYEVNDEQLRLLEKIKSEVE